MIRPHDLATYPLPLIRRAAPMDIPAIVAIEKESFIDPWEESVFLEAFTYFPTTYFVAVCNGAVTGFVVGGLEDTGENIYGHLCNFGVSSAVPEAGNRAVSPAPARAPVRARACHGCPAGSAGIQHESTAVLPHAGL